MSRKMRVVIVAAVLIVLGLGACAGGGLFFYLRYREHQYLTKAEAAFAAREWPVAKGCYAWYLTKHPDDVAVLKKYIEASSMITQDRAKALRDEGHAQFEILKQHPEDTDGLKALLEFMKKHRFWGELEYTASFFSRMRPADAHEPIDDALKYYRALALDRSGRHQEAVDAYSAICDAGTAYLDAYGDLANLLFSQGFREQADGVMAKGVERYPDEPRMELQVARFALKTGDLAKADEAIGKALAGAPADVDILMGAMQNAVAQKRWDDAIGYGEKVRALDPTRSEPYLVLVFLYEQKGDRDKAIDLLKGLDPFVLADNAELFLVLAELQISAGRLEDAEATAEQYRKAYPDHFPIFDYLDARQMLAKGRAADAATKFGAVMQSNPDFVRAQFYQSVAYLESNQLTLAKGALESYLRSRPDDQHARELYDSRFALPQSRDEAMARAKDLLSNNAAAPETLVQAARSVARFGSTSEAAQAAQGVIKDLLEKAIAKDPASEAGYQALGEYLLRQKDMDGARAVVSRAMAAGVDKKELALLEAMIALEEGKRDDSKAIMMADLGRSEATRAEAVRWAEVFANQDELDMGLEALASMAQRSEGEARALYQVEEIALWVNFGHVERALELLEKLGPEIQQAQDAAPRLNEQKLAIARALLKQDSDAAQKEKATQLLSEVEQADASNRSARLLRAELLLQQAQPDFVGAETLARAVLEANPGDVDALLILYDIATTQGRNAEAFEYAQQAASGSDARSPARLALAEAQMNTQRYREARDTLEGILTARRGSLQAMALLVRAYGENGQMDEAKALLSRLEGLAQNNEAQAASLAALRSWLMGREGNWAEAEAKLRERYEADPSDFAVAKGLATALANQGHLDQASDILKRYAKEHDDSADAWLALGQLCLAAKEPDLQGASSAFTRALFVRPGFAPAQRGMIEAQFRSKNLGTALNLCNQYLASQPNDSDVLFLKASLLSQDDRRIDDAIDAVTRAINEVQRPEYLGLRGALYLKKGKYAEALEDFRKRADTLGKSTSAVDAAMADAYLGMKEYDLAKQYVASARQKLQSGEQDGQADAAKLDAIEKRLAEEGGKGQ